MDDKPSATSKTPNLDELREATANLLALLRFPEPGLAGWHMLVGEALKKIAPFVPSETRPTTLSEFVHAPDAVREAVGSEVVDAAIKRQSALSAEQDTPGRIPELEETRIRASYWMREAHGKWDEGRGEPLICAAEAANAWKNAAYAAWDKINELRGRFEKACGEITRLSGIPSSARQTPDLTERVGNCAGPALDMDEHLKMLTSPHNACMHRLNCLEVARASLRSATEFGWIRKSTSDPDDGHWYIGRDARSGNPVGMTFRFPVDHEFYARHGFDAVLRIPNRTSTTSNAK